MVVVAVAGGSGGMGKTIVEQLQLGRKHQVIVLSRSAQSSPITDASEVVKIDYDDVDDMTRVLENRNIDTVISTISMNSEETFRAQMNLIIAADKSCKTRRFTPSEFGTMNTKETVDALKASGLQFTRFVNGGLMDYRAMPRIPSHMSPYQWVIDVANRRAVIPGFGNDLVSVTYSLDVARFVVRSLDSEDWPEHSVIVGSDLTFNEALALVEKFRGGKFDVVYDSEEKLKNNDTTLLSDYEYSWAEELRKSASMFGRMTIAGRFHLPRENRLNERYPDIKPMTVEDMLASAWAGKP